MAISTFPPTGIGRTTVPTLQQTVSTTSIVTLPAGVDQVFYIGMGGGGGGSGTAQTTGIGGSGGGSGYLGYGVLAGLSQSTSLPVVIGAGGTGGTGTGVLGSPGGTTSVGGAAFMQGGFGSLAGAFPLANIPASAGWGMVVPVDLEEELEAQFNPVRVLELLEELAEQTVLLRQKLQLLTIQRKQRNQEQVKELHTA